MIIGRAEDCYYMYIDEMYYIRRTTLIRLSTDIVVEHYIIIH